MAYNSKWFWMWNSDVKYNSTSYVPSKVYDSNLLTNWKYLSTAALGDNSSNKNQVSYAYIRIGYYWDSIDKVNRTAKIHTRLELVEFQNYVCINNQSLLQFGMNIVGHTTMNKTKIKGIIEYKPYLMNVSGYTYANRGSSFRDNYIVYSSNGNPFPYGYVGGNTGEFNNNYGGKSRYIANHIIILDQQEAVIAYDKTGVATATINYDILFGYQIVNNGKKFNASGKGSFVVKDAPKISSNITGIAIASTSKTVTIKPKTMELTGLVNSATKYSFEVTETTSKSQTFGAKVTGYTEQAFEQSFSVTPSSNAEGTVSVTSSNTNVIVINTPSVTVKDGSNKKFKYTCKKPGNATITLTCNGKTAKMAVTVKSDDTFTWSSSNSKIVSVNNGKVTANAGYNGTATITAKSKGNTGLTKTLSITSLLRPSSYTIISDKDTEPLYPGETVKFKVVVNPSFSDTTRSVATQFKGIDWTVANNEATGGGIIERDDVLAEGTNKSGTFEVSYKLKATDNTKDYITFDVSPYYGIVTEDWNYFLGLRNYIRVFIDEPKIAFNKSYLNMSFGSTEKVEVITTPANGKFTLSYDKSRLEITKNDNILTIKALKSGTTQISATGDMPILSYMEQPIAILPINIGTTKLDSITTNKTANYSLDYKSILIGDILEDIESLVELTTNSNDTTDATAILKLKPLENQTINVSYTPKQCNDTILVTSSNTNVVQIADNYDKISLVDKTGKIAIKFNCINDGKATITLKSLNVSSVSATIAVTVSTDKTVNLTATESKFIPEIKRISGPTYNSEFDVYLSSFELRTGNYNGSTKIIASPAKNKNMKDDATVVVRLTPNNVDLYIKKYNGSNITSDDPNDKYCRTISTFVNDKISLEMLLLPNNVSDISRQVNVAYRKVIYTYYADGKLLSDTVVNQLGLRTDNKDNLTDEFVFTVPDSIKADSFKIVADTYEFFGKDLKSSVTINIAQPDLYVKGYEDKDTIDIYLANIPDKSYKNLTVVTTPPNQAYRTSPDISDKSADRGYNLSKNSKNKNILKVNSTGIRNLNNTKKKSIATAKEAVLVNGEPNKNINGYTFQIIYDGYIQNNRTRPVVSTKVYNLEYFGEPYIENIQWNSLARTYELHYYGDRPKFILALQPYNDFDILDDIEFEFQNIKYSFKKNPKLFSIYYNGDTKGHSLISSAIVDYSALGGRHSCIFSPDKAVPDGYVTITYKSTKYSDTIPDASTKIKLIKKPLPTLPKVGDPIRLSDMQQYLNAIADIIGFTGVTYDIVETFGLNLASLDSIGSNDKNKESSISAMPFLKMLLILNRWLDVYKQLSTYTNGKGVVTPSNLSFEPVRNMFVKKSSKEKWYNNKVEDPFFYTTYKKLTGREFLDDSFPEIDYPIMVDDSNDFVGDESYGFTNKFKATDYYKDYTISPLTEIIKALKQL